MLGVLQKLGRLGQSNSSALEQALRQASAHFPLRTNLLALRGSSAITYTRATTGTVFDQDGVMRTAISGEARFTGARRVRNMLTTIDINTWSGSAATVVSGQADADGGTSAQKIVETANSSYHSKFMTITCAANDTVVMRVKAKAGERNWLYLQHYDGSDNRGAWFNLSTGAVGTVESGISNAAISATAQNGFYLCTIKATAGAAATSERMQIALSTGDGVAPTYAGDGTSGLYAYQPQIEIVTGQAIQTPSEYVSVGVLSSPWHGAGVDGVKDFDTANGNTVTSNVVTEATGAPLTTLKGILLEPARTNLCLQSNTFATAPWTFGNVTVAQDAIGLTGAANEAWTVTTTNTSHSHYQYIAVSASTTYTVSWYAKRGTMTALKYSLYDASNAANITAPTSYYAEINGSTLTRVSKTFTTPVGCTSLVAYTGRDSGVTGTYIATAFQCELGANASSYIATTTVAVTRNADVATIPTSGNVTAAAGSVSLEWTPQAGEGATGGLWYSYTDGNNEVSLAHTGTTIYALKRIGGVSYQATHTTTFAAGTRYTVGISWGAAGVLIAVNGVAGTSNANTSTPTITSTLIMSSNFGTELKNNKNLRTWTTQLSQAQLNALTAA